ncbi:MAG: DUF1549 domain-containing protein, partial [Verrucomicrobiae bacterium]|nr:DUF1549 domain-containing protein [Verrucomicrobiae bacterium]
MNSLPWISRVRRAGLIAAAGLALPLFLSAADDEGLVLRWQFDGGKEPGEWQGKAKLSETEEAGPRAPRYPEFTETNRAAFFPGQDAWILVKDQEKGGTTDVRFRKGDSITIEAWVKVKSIGKGHAAYLVGKGRHGERGQNLGEMNQNYAVRLQGTGSGAQLGFLFTSEDPAMKKRDWHRWWSTAEVPSAGWHHVAVVYTFGQKGSLRAYIDGKATEGKWDMGGDTDLPPVADADDLVIGTGYTRTTGTSFSGWMDDLAIYRHAVAPEVLMARYVHTPPPPPVTPDMVPAGEVLVQISEKGVPEANSWPEDPEVTEAYREQAFGFFEEPQKYVSTGVRDDRANPHLFRAAAKVTIPEGKHRLLLRGRGAARLYIDGKKVLETPFRPGDTGGHGLVSSQDEYLDLGPDFRFVPPGNRETWMEYPSIGGEHFVVLETMIGGISGKSKMRPELGETVVAISPEGQESWFLLTPGQRRVAYTDAGWAAYEAERRGWLAEVNAKARATKRTEHADYWAKRREAARQWIALAEPVAVPELPESYPAFNEIDHFIGSRIASVAAASTEASQGSVNYFKDVQPILEARCYDCHRGGKAKGDLKVDHLAAMLKGGKDDGPAIVPGDPKGSSLIWRVTPDEAGDDIMPPKGEPLSPNEIATLTKWIEEGAPWPQFNVKNFTLTPLTDDLTFLRRVFLDTVGVPPSEAEIATFLAADEKSRRAEVIDRLLADARWADHWMGY